jgi:hypothetical protein
MSAQGPWRNQTSNVRSRVSRFLHYFLEALSALVVVLYFDNDRTSLSRTVCRVSGTQRFGKRVWVYLVTALQKEKHRGCTALGTNSRCCYVDNLVNET